MYKNTIKNLDSAGKINLALVSGGGGKVNEGELFDQYYSLPFQQQDAMKLVENFAALCIL